jgi:pyruvate/2-oxoglutarate dehydrogenase complex dihydrolipoamide acyltransferase (E2) component
MAAAQTVPCVNTNDEVVQVVGINVKPGEFVKAGDVIGAVETDKSVVDVVAEQDGYVLSVEYQLEQRARVGSVMFWFGNAPHERVPEAVEAAPQVPKEGEHSTAKARVLLKQFGLDPARIHRSGARLTAADVETLLVGAGKQRAAKVPPSAPAMLDESLSVGGTLHELSSDAAAMLRTVSWQRDRAAAAYLELEYDPKPWEEHAARYAEQQKLMLSPLLPLMAFRLVALGRERPMINATVVDDRRYQYRPVNLGFTVQAGEMLYLTVVRDAQDMDAARFIGALGEVQRHAMAHRLLPNEASGATLSFSSMARWNVSRHIPILPPHTSLIVAHAAPKGAGRAVLGASYDHRLLSGFTVVQVLQALSCPPA